MSLGAATSKHDVERARCLLFSAFSLPALPAGDSTEPPGLESRGPFAEHKFEPAESVKVAMRQRAVLLCSEFNFKAEKP